jgi:hypothetical protein
MVNFFFFQADNARKQPVAQGATCVGQSISLNDKAADADRVHAAALSCPRFIRGTFPPPPKIGKGGNRRNQSHPWGKPDNPAQAPMTAHMVDSA